MKVESLLIRDLCRTDEVRLRSVVDQSLEATVFHSLEWLRFVAEQFGAQVYALLVSEGDVPCGMMPYFRILDRQKGVICKSGNYYCGTVYGGPIAINNVKDKMNILKVLILAYGRIRASDHIVQTYPGFSSDLLQGAQYRTAPIETSILDLTLSEEEIWARMEGRFRTGARRAARMGVEIREGSVEQLMWFAALLARISEERQFEVFPGDLGEAFLRLRNIPGLTRFTVAMVEGANAAGLFLLCFRDVIYFFAAAYDDQYRSSSPNNPLHWEVMRWAKAAGFSKYDLLVLHDPGPALFKRQFNGQIVTFSVGRRTPCFRWIARRVRQWFRDIRGAVGADLL